MAPKKSLPTLSYDEVAKHNTTGDCWVIVEGLVYDLTEFANDHPGGSALVTDQAGKDATVPFVDAHATDIIPLTLGGAAGVAKALKGKIDMATVPKSAVSGAAAHGPPPAAPGGDDEVWETPPLDAVLNLHDFEAIAQRNLTAAGKKQAFDYYSSGASDELTYNDNVAAFRRVWLRPRILVDVATCDVSSTILGAETSLPLFLSACAMCGMGHPDGELAWAKAAADEGIPFMSPNLSSKSRAAVFEAQQQSPEGHRWFQIYVNPDRKVVLEQLRACEAAGVTCICVTVDSAVAGPRERDQRNKIAMKLGQMKQQAASATGTKARKPGVYANRDPALNWKDIAWFRKNTKIPIVLKGVQTGEDAVLAAKAGVAAILVSNHGGRNMDTARSSLEALPEVIEALEQAGVRQKLEVWLDGGIRRGSDIVKALALGADACGIGKPAMYAMSAYGAEGISRCTQILKKEMIQTMQLCGTTTLKGLNTDLVCADSLADHSRPAAIPPSPYAPSAKPAAAAAAAPAAAAVPNDPAALRIEIAALQARLKAVEREAAGGGGVLAALQRGPLASAATALSAFLSGWIVCLAWPLAGLFSMHVAAMAVAALFLPTLALQLVRGRTAHSAMSKRAWAVKLHAFVQVAAVGFLAGGFYAIYAHKEASGAAHFESNHSKAGLAALGLSGASLAVAVYRAVPAAKNLFAPKWIWGSQIHRWLGVASYLAAALAAVLGVAQSKWGAANLGDAGIAAFAALAAVAVGAALVPFVPPPKKKQD